jgi:hypothetical protein
MLLRNTLTGYLHEVPDYQLGYWGEVPEQLYGVGQVIYDGLGNPVGLPFLAPIAAALAPMAEKIVGGLLSPPRPPQPPPPPPPAPAPAALAPMPGPYPMPYPMPGAPMAPYPPPMPGMPMPYSRYFRRRRR